MKNGNLIFQTLIGLAVAALFVLHFMDGDKGSSKGGSMQMASHGEGGPKIAFIYVDSLMTLWDYQNELSADLQARMRVENERLSRAEDNLMQEQQILRQYAPSLDEAALNNARNDYMQKEQNYVRLNQAIQAKVKDDRDSVQAIVQAGYDAVIAEMQKDMGFDYLLQYETSMVYADSTTDVTMEMVRRLNEMYPPLKGNDSEE
ncbi:MAG: OmpH family outer membrane protein [Flavobacteriia bacterium]|nr:OmpH family outer membrane protein [Flavobacteriia bacterium]